ncbi:hypothetical protein QBC46DRAFT_93901 [Diplogelasinospora grovesii]|uniref:Peroxin 20 n=1 Tax=Diplogelasinospora grovesii TaxID=303347 RepID=A0AAN6NK82_9PEZI|nr:hypothetical protein QBC46DRAFT_93901 [Diplogelasinospora grovesii]
MADNMCGPSNGAKNLVSHVDRDRTLHQDRYVNSAQPGGGASFRSQTAASHGADRAFESFQQGPALHPPMPPLSYTPYMAMNNLPASALSRDSPRTIGGAPAALNAPGHQTQGINAPAIGRTAHEGWVDQFATMQLGYGAARNGSPMLNQYTPPAATSYAFPGAATQLHPMGYTGPSYMFPMRNFQTSGFHATSKQPEAGFMPEAGSALDVDAFNRAFGDYDDTEFQQELANWAQEHGSDNKELAAAQDDWMAQHGPRAEAKIKPLTAAEMAVIDADLELLAQDLERRQRDGDPAVLPTKGEAAEARRRKRQDDELAKAAVDILASVSTNQSEKFRNSSFLELMRRIGNKEIVVEGNNLVDAETGETIASKEDPSNDAATSTANSKGKEKAGGF